LFLQTWMTRREVIIRPRRTKNDTAQYIFLEYTTDSSFDHILPSISVGARFLPKRLSSSLACCETNKDAEVCSLLLTHTNLYKCLIPHRPRKGKERDSFRRCEIHIWFSSPTLWLRRMLMGVDSDC